MQVRSTTPANTHTQCFVVGFFFIVFVEVQFWLAATQIITH